MTPRVSILIPAYSERFFGDAFESAIAQEHDSFEVVVCDDSAGRIVANHVEALHDERVRYVKNESRLGFEGNFTKCLSEARGELVKFLNDDDRLRPTCIARLAEAFDRDPKVKLATSRRQPIDEAGNPRAELPATTPVSHANCMIEGFEFGNLVLMNSLNLIGEPSTVMFRRADVAVETGGVFTWERKSYRCLADLSLWLRLLAQGTAYYHATALSEYRVHPEQEQRQGALDCITERFDLAKHARAAGFLAAPGQYEAALERVDALAKIWMARPGVSESDRAKLGELCAAVAAMLASPPAA